MRGEFSHANEQFTYLLVDQGFSLNPLVLRTFALAHLALLDGIDDFSKEKPIGTLILSMQAVRYLFNWLILTDNDRWAALSSTGKRGKSQARSHLLSLQTTSMISGSLQRKQLGHAARSRRSVYVAQQSLFKPSRISKNPNGI